HFLKAQNFLFGQKLITLVENFGGHTVCAAEVAAVCDRDAQVAERSAKGILNGGVAHTLGASNTVFRSAVVNVKSHLYSPQTLLLYYIFRHICNDPIPSIHYLSS